ncbi:hypothetical protein ES695_01260 [Candidatus Atribacteria bacterium 1244-E10-H5-B2]|nr:MAG: hypothetical protein ES695_01260 [Candidatus Atribacteria bacterium 1244-E10-H5-B2]
MKAIFEFQRMGDKKASLKICCYNEKHKEINDLSRALKKKGFTVTYAYKDSLRARIFGEFNHIERIGEELQKKGFTMICSGRGVK